MLFSLSGNYTSAALDAMRESPETDRRVAAEKLVAAAGGKIVGFYFTMADGPGIQVIIDADPIAAAAITGTVVSSGAIQNVKMSRLWSNEEVAAIRRKRAEIHGAYKPPGR